MTDTTSIRDLMGFGMDATLANLLVKGQPARLNLTAATLTATTVNATTIAPTTINATTGNITTVNSTTVNATTVVPDAITGGDSSLGITGQAAAQGGAIVLTGGKSSTSGNAGGAVSIVGGLGGATGAGGALTFTGGAGTATAAGGALTFTGGASGAGATGNGGAASVIGGAALSTNGSGGNAVITGGASTGTGAGSSVILTPGAVSTGAAGAVASRGLVLQTQAAPTAYTTATTMTAAAIISGLVTGNAGGGAAVNYQLPVNTNLDAALPADIATNDAFDFSIINLSTVAAEDITVTTNTGWTLVGSMVVESRDSDRANSSGHFRVRRTGASAYTIYRLA